MRAANRGPRAMLRVDHSGYAGFPAPQIYALENKTPPNFGDVLTFRTVPLTCRSSRLLLRHLRVHDLNRGADLDRAQLGCLRHFTNHVDAKQAIVEASARHLHVVG